jgi:hypothetical protein
MMHSQLTLERELQELFGTGRNAFITARYYGFDGRGGRTLETIGNEIGVTKERVHQIVTAAAERARIGRPLSPTLDRTIAFVVDRMPGAAGEIEVELRSEGLTCGLFRLEGLIKAAELLGRPLPFSITEVSEERLVYSRDIPSVDPIVNMARRVTSHLGMATPAKVVAELRKLESSVCDRKLVVCTLACLGDFHWLERAAGWFWLSDNRRNPILSRIRKILSVANPINISELWAGISRDFTMRWFSVPKRVLLEFCRQAPGLRVDDKTVKADPVINSDGVLNRTEREIVQMLSEQGGTMTTSELTSMCLDTGMNRQTFYRTVETSPIISRYAHGSYRLIGSHERSGGGARFSSRQEQPAYIHD